MNNELNSHRVNFQNVFIYLFIEADRKIPKKYKVGIY